MMRTTRDGIGGTPRRALAATLLVGAMALASFGALIGPARAADESATAEGADAGSAAAEQRIPSVAAATRLLAIEAERTQGGTLLRLRANGEIANAKTVVLENPTRLVLDLPGLKSAMAARGVDVGSDQAARVRIGQHDDKLRIVVDGGPIAGPFEARALMPQQDGLWVGLGSEAARLAASSPAEFVARMEPMAAEPSAEVEAILAEPIAGMPEPPAAETPVVVEIAPSLAAEAPPIAAVNLAPAPVSAAAEAVSETEEALPLGGAAPVTIASESPEMPAPAGSVKVHGVQYDAQPDRDRLVIVQEGTAPHSLLRPDAETLVVSLQNAVLDPGATIRVTPQDPGPISLVTAIQMPNATTPEVRIAIAHAPGAEPKVTQEGDFLLLDFPRSNNLEAALSKTPDPDRVERIAHSAAAASSSVAPATPAPTRAPAAAAGAGAGASSDLLKEGGLVGGKTYTGRRLSLDFKDVEISDVLRLIADVSDLNVIAGDEVKGQVTIRLTDVPWDQALDVMLLTKGLGFVHVGNVLRIAPQEVLKAEEAARLEDRRAKEKLEDLVVKIHPVNYSKATELEPMVKKLLTSRGTVNVDVRTNTLVLKDIQSVVAESLALVKAVDTPTPQVLIESKIVEAKLDFTRDLGAVWGIGSNPDVDGFDGGTPPNETVPGTSFGFQQPNNVVVSNPITSSANGLMNLGGYILNDRFNLTLQLQASEANGETKTISSPRVVTLDNRKAVIKQGVSIPYQTFENGDAQLNFIDAVLSLEVTPHITADKSIIMKILVTRNSPDFAVAVAGTPGINKNEADTETLVKDGQTLVLGGIYVIDRSDKATRVPFLYRIPILGNAFKNNSIKDNRKELLIFVTPRIVQTETAQN